MEKRKTMATETTGQKPNSESYLDQKTVKFWDDKFFIVGIGASAGGLEAFKEFFTAMPSTPDMAFVLIQHFDPNHKSLLVQLLKNHTQMTVTEVEDNTKVVPDHVYIIPPNKNMAIFNGVLHLIEPSESRGFWKPIDFFLSSLAEDQRERSVGIILSGTGTEGTLSLKKIKGHGGLAVVQDPKTAKYDEMPRSAISAGAEDFVLPVHEMPNFLITYRKNRKIVPQNKLLPTSGSPELWDKIFTLLRNETGCDFCEYKEATLMRQIEKRMAINQMDKLEDYIKYLQTDRGEVVKLFQELLIGVTCFFRDKEAFRVLQEIIIPRIIRDKKDGDDIRIWVPGCSTGEEAYSLAILFNEAICQQSKKIKVQIFASDLDENAINCARKGVYLETIALDMPPEILARYFQPETVNFRIRKEIRDQVIFSGHNLLKDPPFSKQDLVSCRNLLIYLKPEAQRKVVDVFHYALKPHGILFIGSSESLGNNSYLFEVLDQKNKLYRHKTVDQDEIPNIGHLFRVPIPIINAKNRIRKKDNGQSLASITEQLLLADYAPACTIINHKGVCVYFSGNTGSYLQPLQGEAQLNILNMATGGLRTELCILINKVRKTLKMKERKGITIEMDGRTRKIDLRIRPMNHLEPIGDYLMVTFHDREEYQEKITGTMVVKSEEVFELHALEQELAETKEYLRSTIEQLEVSNVELKYSNEELQSSNEELQCTNEEMETSKEELQSINEELITVNTELQAKMDELANTNDDLDNLLASTEIGTLFLDSELIIKRFTPSMSQIFNLIPSDVNRSVRDLSSNLINNRLLDELEKVLTTLVPLKTTVKSKDGTWYQMRAIPYQNSENVIKGLTVTFVDTTQETLVTEELKDIKERYEQLLSITKTMVYTQDNNLVYTSLSDKHPDFEFRNIVGKTDQELFSGHEAKVLNTIKKKVLRTGEPARESVQLELGGRTRFYDLVVRPVLENNKIIGIDCTSMDITEFAMAERDLKVLKKDENG